MKDLISVIVPVYNREKNIADCIESLLQQTYDNLEIILVDDGSKDSSLDICNKYAQQNKKIKIVSKENGGVSSARNAGLKAATGDYIGFVDADDEISPEMYNILLNNIYKYNVKVSICAFACNEKTILPKGELVSAEYFLKRNIKNLNVWNKLFHRETISNLYFDERLKYAEDMLFCFYAILRTDKVFCDKRPLYFYHVNEASATRKLFNAAQFASFRVFRELENNAEIINRPSLHKALEMYKIYNMVGFLRSFIISGFNKKHVISYFLKNIRLNIISYMFTTYPLFNRLFALSAAVNFNLTKSLYKFIFLKGNGKR